MMRPPVIDEQLVSSDVSCELSRRHTYTGSTQSAPICPLPIFTCAQRERGWPAKPSRYGQPWCSPFMTTLISSYEISPTSPTHSLPVDGSAQIRHGLRKPQAQIASRGMPVAPPVNGLTPHESPHCVTPVLPTSGLSAGMLPSRPMRRIFPFAAPLLFGSSARHVA